MDLRPSSPNFLLLVLTVFLLAIAIPNYIPAKARESCPDANLPAITEAKKRWAEENGMGEKAVPKIRDLLPYLTGGRMSS